MGSHQGCNQPTKLPGCKREMKEVIKGNGSSSGVQSAHQAPGVQEGLMQRTVQHWDRRDSPTRVQARPLTWHADPGSRAAYLWGEGRRSERMHARRPKAREQRTQRVELTQLPLNYLMSVAFVTSSVTISGICDVISDHQR